MTDPVLARATRDLRAESDEAAAATAADGLGRRVAAAARVLPRRSWWLRSDWPASSGGSGPLDADSLRVTDRAVVSALRLALEPVPGAVPIALDIRSTDRRCTGARIALGIGYGTAVAQVADQVRAVAHAVLTDLFGADDAAPFTIDVDVTDVLALSS